MTENTQILISCNRRDWLASLLQVSGVRGISPQYTSILGSDLPNEAKSGLLSVIDMFRSMGAEQWTASQVYCKRRYAGSGNPKIVNGAVTETHVSDAVDVTLVVDVDLDKTILHYALEDAGAVALYDSLVQPEFWRAHIAARRAARIAADLAAAERAAADREARESDREAAAGEDTETSTEPADHE